MSALNITTTTIGKLKNLLKEAYEVKYPIFIWGEPGIGKSYAVSEFCKEQQLQLNDVRITTIEAADLRGLPFIDQKGGKTRWYHPEFLPDPSTGKDSTRGAIFLDELTAAEHRLRASCYELLLDRRVGSYKVPDDWWVLGAGNAPEHGAIAYAMTSAEADRFIHVSLVTSAEDWIKWAQGAEVAPEVITFIKIKPDFLNTIQNQAKGDQVAYPSPRSWHRVSTVLQKVRSHENQRIMIAGLVGSACANEFNQTVEEVGKLPDMKTLLEMKPKDAVKMIPATVSALYGLTYSLNAYVNTPKNVLKAMDLYSAVADVKDGQPRREIETLGVDMLFAKILQNDWMKQVQGEDAFKKYLPKLKEIVESK